MAFQEYKLFGAVDLKLGYVVLGDVGTGGIDDMATSLPSANIAAEIFALEPSVMSPVPIMVSGVELMSVTAANVGTGALTVVRAQGGTTAVAHTAGVGKIAVMSEADMPFVNAFSMDPNIDNITFEGDGTQEQVPVSNGVTGSFTLGKFTTAILDAIAGVTKITSGLPADEAARWYPELGSYPYVRGRCLLKAQDETTGAEVRLRVEVPKMKIQNPWVPGDAGNNAAMNSEIAWSSTGTNKDLIGATLPGLTAGDTIHYSLATMA
jgi:hypothetical protein